MRRFSELICTAYPSKTFLNEWTYSKLRLYPSVICTDLSSFSKPWKPREEATHFSTNSDLCLAIVRAQSYLRTLLFRHLVNPHRSRIQRLKALLKAVKSCA